MNEKVCCIIGGRSQSSSCKFNEKDKRYINLKKRLRIQIEIAVNKGFTLFIVSGARGIEQDAMQMIIELRKEAQIELEVAAPYVNQADSWPLIQRARYHELLTRANNVLYFSPSYTPDSIIKSHKYMVDRSSLVIAVTNGRPEVTISTLRYALFKEIDVKILHPASKKDDDDIFFENTLKMLLLKRNKN